MVGYFIPLIDQLTFLVFLENPQLFSRLFFALFVQEAFSRFLDGIRKAVDRKVEEYFR